MTGYVESSALLKLYVDEPETAAAAALTHQHEAWTTGRHTLVEVRRNLARVLTGADLVAARAAFDEDWRRILVVELDRSACDAAARLAESTGVRTLDALHLGAAEVAGAADGLPLITFDRRLAVAARSLGWRVLPQLSSVEETVAAVGDGEVVVIPTDTVYGLACRPDREDAVRALSALKRRSQGQPIALVAADADALVAVIPELDARLVVPGPFTLVLPNPARRLPWLTGSRPTTIGVRVPEVSGPARGLLERVGVVAATSANLHGGPDPRSLDDVPAAIREGVAAVLDAGELPGTPSTVLDLTGPEPRVLREGAVPAAEALARMSK